ncbi:mannopine transport system permease protein [Bradyrhizobium shewense]|uniref:Mannopine transport system permease protein n=1 Tax=Bradyrhizobium shewense TaxID=1761772 RepID=A0A1C3WSA7_9BRAD|nr:mannopine transport system permease protein [Bradyrhizobium shewense]
MSTLLETSSERTSQSASPSNPAFSPAIGRWLLNGFASFVLVFLLLPTLIVIPMSLGHASYIQFPPQGLTLKWYRAYFDSADWMSATWFSLRIALATTASATVIGTLASFAVVRGNLPGIRALQALTLAPLIVPHIVLAVALYLVFAPLGLTGNFVGFAIAHTMLSVPYVMLTVSAALQRIDPALELAALNCGASRAQAFWHVVLPNIAPGVAAGAVFAFLASFDEATVAFFISGVEGKTITRKLFEDIDYNLTPIIAAASTVMIVVSLALMGGVEWLRSRSENSGS